MAKITNRFSIWLVNELLKRGWTVDDLADRSGLAPSTITRIIDHRGGLGLKAMHKLAEGIGVTERDLFDKFEHSETIEELGDFLDEVIYNTINLSDRDKEEILAFIRNKRKMAKKYNRNKS